MASFIGAGGGVLIPMNDASARTLGYDDLEKWLEINDKYGMHRRKLGLDKPVKEEVKVSKPVKEPKSVIRRITKASKPKRWK